METISVYYKLIPNTLGVYYHKYIVYTDSNGNQYAAAAYPVKNVYGPGFGIITTIVGVYDEGFVDYPSDGSTRQLPFPDGVLDRA